MDTGTNGHNNRQLPGTLIESMLWAVLLAIVVLVLLSLPMKGWQLKLMAVAAVLLGIVVGQRQASGRIHRLIGRVAGNLGFLNRGSLDQLSADVEGIRDPAVDRLNRRLGHLASHLHGLLSHLNHIAQNLHDVSLAVDDQLVRYIHDVRNQITNTDVTIKSANGIQQFITDISDNIRQLNDIAMETLNFLNEIVGSNDNVNIKMESLSAYARETEASMNDIIGHTQKVTTFSENLSSMVVETSTSLMEMDATINEIQKQARYTENLAREATRAARDGLQHTRETAQTVTQAGENFLKVSQKIRELRERSTRISEIIVGIRRISEQTSLLALNATISASHGESSGQDMAVIADKIRELAISSSLSMKEIQDVLSSMQNLVDSGHALAEEGDGVVRSGVARAQQAAENLEQIVDRLESVLEGVGIMTRATEEHAEGSAQVNRAAQEISRMTEEIAALMATQEQIVQGVGNQTVYVAELVTSMKQMVAGQTGKTQQLLDRMKEIGLQTRHILSQSRELELSNQRIIHAIRNIREIADNNYRNASVLSSSAVSLEKLSWFLGNKLKTFDLPKPRHGGTLTIAGLPLAHGTLDPLQAVTVQEAQIHALLHAGLVRFDTLFNPVPDIARSWTVSPDGRSYTFVLREDATFHNGQPVGAGDVVATFRRLLDPRFQCPSAGLFEMLKGAVPFMEQTSDELTGVRSEGPHTVVFELDNPVVFFPHLLALSYAAVVPQSEYLKGPDTPFTPVGCGPFRVLDFEPGKRLLLERHHEYHHGNRPYADRVQVLLNSVEDPLDKVQEGSIDILSVSEPQELEAVEAREDLHEQVLTATQLSTYFLAVNCRIAPWDSPDVRTAVSLAIDRQEICDSFPLKLAEPAHSVLPPGLLGYDPDTILYEYDPEKARWLLEQAGFDFDRELEITFAKRGQGVPSDIQVVQDCLNRVGIQVRLNGMAQHWPYVEALKHMMFRVGWVADYPDSDNFIYSIFHQKGGDVLQTGFHHDRVDRLAEKARHLLDTRERLTHYREIERMLSEAVPVIPLYHKKEAVVQSPRLANVTIKGFAPFLDADDIWFTQLY